MDNVADNLRRHVERLAGVIGPRHVGRPLHLRAAAELVDRELTASGFAVERQRYVARGQDVANLIAELPGTARPEEVVVVGAHYDSERGTPGADDNASAVAVMLEAARLLRPVACERTVRFVAFTCEESPHFYTSDMGSQVYARRCRARGERIVGMLCLEMLGYYSAAPGSQRAPATIPRFLSWILPRTADFVAAVGNLSSWRLLWSFRRGFRRAVSFPLFSICLPELVREIRLSDNSSFWDEGYPALMVTDTSFLRNPHYHQASDTPDTLDYGRMALVTRGVIGSILNVARGPRQP